MKVLLPRLAATAAVLALGASGAFAQEGAYEGDTLQHTVAQSSRWERFASSSRQASLGSEASARAERVVVLDGSVRHLRVTQQEHVTFEVDGKRFTWNFDTLGTPTFDLAEIAPKGVDVGQVEVHVAPNPLYIGG